MTFILSGIIINLNDGKEENKMKQLLGKNKKFYKANLHAHTTLSDGRLTPEELKNEYKKRGYSIVAYTDHEHIIAHPELNDENFLTITSCELAIKEDPHASTAKKTNLKTCHLNFYALDPENTVTPFYSPVYDHFLKDEIKDLISYEGEYTREYTPEAINKMIEEGKKLGFIVSYNHPGWSLEDAGIYLNYDGFFTLEIFNTGCVRMGIADDEHVYDEMLRMGKRIFCSACDDNHNAHPIDSPKCDSFGGWVQIDAPALEYSAIMNALIEGDFYASTGPEIYSLSVDEGKVKIKTSPATKISIIPQGRSTRTVYGNSIGEEITEAEFALRPDDDYFRIRVEDKYGKKAYTRAYFTDEE